MSFELLIVGKRNHLSQSPTLITPISGASSPQAAVLAWHAGATGGMLLLLAASGMPMPAGCRHAFGCHQSAVIQFTRKPKLGKPRSPVYAHVKGMLASYQYAYQLAAKRIRTSSLQQNQEQKKDPNTCTFRLFGHQKLKLINTQSYSNL